LILRQKDNSSKVLALSVALFLFVISSGLIAYRLFRQPGNRPVFLSQQVSWAIAMESLKLSPLLGTGPSTYLSDFTRFKPVTYNLTPNWAIRFTSASNYYLQILTTLGLLGLTSMVFLAYKVIDLLVRSIRSASESPAHSGTIAALVSAALILTSLLFIPPSIITLFLLFILLILAISSFKLMGSSLVHEANIDIELPLTDALHPPWISCLALKIILILFSASLLCRNFFRKPYMLPAKTKAVTLTRTWFGHIIIPKDSYRVTASQINLLKQL
jgi:hypothetical protein